MISTSFITGTGFMKCIPTTWAGLEVTAAIRVIEIDEVLVARIACAGAKRSISLNIFSFKSTFSVAASTTRSAPLRPPSISIWVVMFARAASFCSSVRLPLVIWRSIFLPILASALSRAG
ncbi:hypothetical protein D9M68_797450 [compost metagenome]